MFDLCGLWLFAGLGVVAFVSVLLFVCLFCLLGCVVNVVWFGYLGFCALLVCGVYVFDFVGLCALNGFDLCLFYVVMFVIVLGLFVLLGWWIWLSVDLYVGVHVVDLSC